MKAPSMAAPVLVTGAGGLIGSAICHELCARSIPVRGLLAPEESVQNLEGLTPITLIRGDVRDRAAMMAATEGCQSIIHAAALNKLWHRPSKDFYAINVQGTEHLCHAALKARVSRFLLTSSCEVFGPAQPGRIVTEQQPLEPSRIRGHYERSKFLAEEVARHFQDQGLHLIIMRPTAVMGPGDIHGTPPGRLIRAFLASQIPAYYDTGINIVDSRDVAALHVAALLKAKPGDIYIAAGHNVRLRTLFHTLAAVCARPAPTRRVGYQSARMGAWLAHCFSTITGKPPPITGSAIRTIRYPWYFNGSKASAELGGDPRPLEKTLKDTVAWHLKYHERRTDPDAATHHHPD